MTRESYPINIDYRFEPQQHKGAPYSVDGIHWTNSGEFAEIVTNAVKGYNPHKDANTAFDEGSDIPELNASVKSSRFTLTTVKLGNSFEEVFNAYFDRVHSTSWIYTVIIDDMAVLYTMNKAEFQDFLRNFSSYSADRKVIRGKHTSGIMLRWLEERV